MQAEVRRLAKDPAAFAQLLGYEIRPEQLALVTASKDKK